MRFLCLHGRGTSSQIFELQTARLREELSSHEFVFIDGVVSTEPSEGAEAVTDEFFGWFDNPINQTQSQELLLGLVEFIANNGPFQGVMGFSEGGIVAAMLLAEDARQGFAGFQCGILISAAPPLDPAAISQEPASLRCLNPAVDGLAIRVPTAHIIGSNDPIARLVALSPLSCLWTSSGMGDPEKLHQYLFQLCNDERELFSHQLGHEVPGTKSAKGLSGALRVIERTIERAQLGQRHVAI